MHPAICLLEWDKSGHTLKPVLFPPQIKAFEKMDHLARAQRMLELQEAENARVSGAALIISVDTEVVTDSSGITLNLKH